MKPGDRVIVARGTHAGRIGMVLDPDHQVSLLRAALLPSPVRDLIESKLRVPDDHTLVKLNSEYGPSCVVSWPRTAIPTRDLMPIARQPETEASP